MEIHWVGMSEVQPTEQAEVEARLEGLAEGHSDLIDLRITGHQTRHHNRGGKEVRVTCHARGREIVAGRTASDLGLALNEVLDVFEREVHKMREKGRSARRTPPPEWDDSEVSDQSEGDPG